MKDQKTITHFTFTFHFSLSLSLSLSLFTTSLRLGPSAAWAFGLQEVEVVGEQIWLLGVKALAQNVQD